MTEEARPVVKNNKLLQYPSGQSMDTGTSGRTSERERKREGGIREKEKGRKRDIQKSRERTDSLHR